VTNFAPHLGQVQNSSNPAIRVDRFRAQFSARKALPHGGGFQYIQSDTRVEALVLLSRQGPLYRPSTLAPTNIDTAANVVWAALKPRRKSASEKVTNRSVGWCQCGLARFPVS
jgi:hypothetical protein